MDKDYLIDFIRVKYETKIYYMFFSSYENLLYNFEMHSSFPVMHKVGNVDIFVLHKFKSMTDREIYYIN